MQKFILIIMISLVHMAGISQSYELMVNITDIVEIKGSARIAVFDNAGHFKQKFNPTDSAVIEIKTNAVSHAFKLSKGVYAIAVYHDENNDMQLNKRSLGIPIEGIGFSNITTKTTRPPVFDESSFTLKNDTTLQIPIFYDKK